MVEKVTPINQNCENTLKKKVRNSNLELYRIIVMLLIVAHHFVVNSGLSGLIREQGSPLSISSAAMVLFGAWGKTGINCFVLITGYFMCKSSFSWRKLLKLYLQIAFYAVVIYGIFCITGHESLSAFKAAFLLFPVKSIASGFVNCFLLFYLFIPFLNLFLKHLDKRMHTYLVLLLVAIYSVLPSIPIIWISFNYVEWFIVLYFIAAYIRNYGADWAISHRQWGYMALATLLVSCASVLGLFYMWGTGRINSYIPYFFISDSNKFLAFALAVTSFMWFKDLKMKYYPFINAVGATTFGVLLIHANSDAMR